MTKRIVTLWERLAVSAKHLAHRPLVPEYDEPRACYRQSTRYSNTY